MTNIIDSGAYLVNVVLPMGSVYTSTTGTSPANFARGQRRPLRAQRICFGRGHGQFYERRDGSPCGQGCGLGGHGGRSSGWPKKCSPLKELAPNERGRQQFQQPSVHRRNKRLRNAAASHRGRPQGGLHPFPAGMSARTTGSETAALAAAIKATAVLTMRQRVSIASQYGQNDAPWRSALRVLLGTDCQLTNRGEQPWQASH